MRYLIQPLTAASGLTDNQLLRTLKFSGKTFLKYSDEGMQRETAERAAMALGFHPYEVWPEMADHDHDAAHAAQRENERRWQRNWYRNADPEVKARVLASARRYKAGSARALSLYNKRYREANKERIAARQAAHYRENRERILARQRAYDRRRRLQEQDAQDRVHRAGEAA